jgi:hypothetical protein
MDRGHDSATEGQAKATRRCGERTTQGPRPPVGVRNCHGTQAARDWLCRRCNAGLGLFRDNPAALRAAADYIERHRATPVGAVAFLRSEMARCHPRSQSRAAGRLLDERAETLGKGSHAHRTAEL